MIFFNHGSQQHIILEKKAKTKKVYKKTITKK